MKRILVIDDDDLARRDVRRLLECGGYEVVEASNGRKGVLYYHESPIDLVITDILMPEQDGLEVIMELRRVNPKVKIIAVAYHPEAIPLDFLRIARLLGACHVLQKPLTQTALLQLVRAELGPPSV